jgi:hypothetical protein
VKLVAVIALGCAGCGAKPRPDDPAITGVAPTTAGDVPTLLVASDAGVREVDLDGRLVVAWSTRRASQLAALGPGRAVVLDDAGRVAVVTAAGERDVARIPLDWTCDAGSGDRDERLSPSQPGAFATSPDGQRLCMILTELEYDAAFQGYAAVDLETGRVHVEAPPGCRAAAATTPPGPAIRCTDDTVVSAGDGASERPEVIRSFAGIEFRLASTSPSGRWLLFSGDEVTGSSFYVRHALVEVATDRMWTVPGTAGPWPAPLDPAHPPPLDPYEPGALAGLVSYTEDIEWMSGDVLRIGHLLLRPGERTIDLGGRTIPTPL